MDAAEAKRADITIKMLHDALVKTTEMNAELAKANADLHAGFSQVKEELRRKDEELQGVKSDNERLVAAAVPQPVGTAPGTLCFHVNICFGGQENNSKVHFMAKYTTKFERVFDMFCVRKSLDPDKVRFLYYGSRINPTQTPRDLKMENGEAIDALMEQKGGSSSSKSYFGLDD